MPLTSFSNASIALMFEYAKKYGSYLFPDNPDDPATSQWIFGDFSTYTWPGKSKGLKHLKDVTSARDIVIDPGNQEVWVNDIESGKGIMYVFKDGAMQVPAGVPINIKGAALVLTRDFVNFEGDVVAGVGTGDFATGTAGLADYIHFSRKAFTVDKIRMMYHDIATMMEDGFRKQQAINDAQDAGLATTLDGVSLENIILQKVLGITDIPIVSLPGEGTNPFYLGRHATIADLQGLAPATNYVDFTDPEAPVVKPYFGYIKTPNPLVALVKSSAANVTGPFSAVQEREFNANTGTRMNSVIFPATLSAASYWNSADFYEWDKDQQAAYKLGSLQIIDLFDDEIYWMNPTGSDMHHLYFNGIAQVSWSVIQNDITIAWNQGTKTLSFTSPVSILNITGGLEFLRDKNAQYSFSAATSYEWSTADGILPSNPAYRDWIEDPSQLGGPGALRSSMYKEIKTDSRLISPILSTPNVGQLLNGTILKHNPNGVPPASTPSETDYATTGGTKTIKFIKDANNNVVCSYWDGINTTSIPLVNAPNDWGYFEVWFDPIIAFGLTEMFYYTGESGDPWEDNRIDSYLVVNVPELKNEIDGMKQMLHDAGIGDF
jgi:hypothetical protein